MRAPPPVRRLLRIHRSDAGEERRQVEEEMRLHLELRVEQLVAEGMERQQAEAEARRRFARRDATLLDLYRTAHERNRRMRLHDRMESWWMDMRYAARGLLRDPLVAAFVVVALALGMGGAVTAFSLVDHLLLRDPAHVRAPDRLVRLFGTVPNQVSGPTTSAWIPDAPYRALRDGVPGLEGVAAVRITERTVGRGAGARKLQVADVRDGYLTLIGVVPVRGRLFNPEEDAATTGPLAVVSERLWREMLGSAEDVVGRSLAVGEATYTVVGVTPGGFSGGELRRVDAWLLADGRDAGTRNWQAVARLAPGVTAEAVSTRADAVFRGSAEEAPGWFREARIHAGDFRLDVQGQEPFAATMARWLMGIAGLILLVALGNVANLLLARLARRRRELAVRVALGSGRARLLRLVALEGALLAAAAGALAVLVVRIVEPVVRRALLSGDAAWSLTLLDGRMLAALMTVVALTAAVVGALPALRVRRGRLGAALRGDARGGGVLDARTRGALTVMQTALSVVLLVGAGLFLHSLVEVRRVDLGVDRELVLTGTAELPPPQAYTREGMEAHRVRETAVFRAAAEAVRAMPGVAAVAVAVGIPLDGGAFGGGVYLPGRDSVPSLPGGGPFVSAVGAGYFETVGTPLLEGRGFTEADGAGTQPVVIVSRTMAATLWPGRSPLGECIGVVTDTGPCATVVGVVADVHRVGVREEASMQFYLPLDQQRFFSGATLVVRQARPGAAAPAALQAAMVRADPSIRIAMVQPLTAALDDELRPLRLGMTAFGLSSALALLVAVLGLYSVMAYSVAWRTRELGIRAALGATVGQLSGLVVRQGTTMAVAGVALGLLLALAGGRWLEPHLFRTATADPLVLGGVAALLLAVALLASWLPARRAARIPPTEALRAE